MDSFVVISSTTRLYFLSSLGNTVALLKMFFIMWCNHIQAEYSNAYPLLTCIPSFSTHSFTPYIQTISVDLLQPSQPFSSYHHTSLLPFYFTLDQPTSQHILSNVSFPTCSSSFTHYRIELTLCIHTTPLGLLLSNNPIFALLDGDLSLHSFLSAPRTPRYLKHFVSSRFFPFRPTPQVTFSVLHNLLTSILITFIHLTILSIHLPLTDSRSACPKTFIFT